MLQKIPLNDSWYFKPDFISGDRECTPDTTGYERVDLPHTNRMLPYNYFSEASYQFISCYKKLLEIPKNWEGTSVYLEFEGVMVACNIYCNGIPAGRHEGGYTPFTVEITEAVRFGEENVIVAEVDSRELENIPPFGNVVDYLTYGGIYREVWLYTAGPVRLERLWLNCPDPLAEKKTLRCDCEITAEKGWEGILELILLSPDHTEVKKREEKITVEPGPQKIPLAFEGLWGISLWDTKNPVLYQVEARLKEEEGSECCSFCSSRFGFREARFTAEGFFLNGKKEKLIGLNRHQSWPYVGYAMPKRIQRRDAQLLREELGCNMVRTSHYPQSRHFLDACDELGLLVMEEIPGWQHIGNEEWKQHSLEDVKAMITRDYNRPSVVLWGVRINESQDDHSFYERTNALARALDPGRQTGGTRYIQRSELLEDVYTYNDFTHDGGKTVFRPQKDTTGLEAAVPLLVTESNGHMYPTKRFDQEARLTEHALRHLRVIHESLAREDLAGGISWCAFDYNTHGSFGSGDKICYHGVFDMFRNPKYAAYAYASQKEAKDGPVLEPVTLASRGERDGGGMVPFYLLTNCDFVRVYKNGKKVSDFYPQKKEFPYLKHPPVAVSHLMEEELLLDFSKEDREGLTAFLEKKIGAGTLTSLLPEDFAYLSGLAQRYGRDVRALVGMVIKSAGGWGDTENNLVLEGWLDGQAVCRREIGESRYFEKITVTADDQVLYAGGETYDATRITVKALDQRGNLLPFTQECVAIRLDGPAKLMGPDRFPLTGGISSFWIRTVGTAGTVSVCVQGVEGRAECRVEVEERESRK